MIVKAEGGRLRRSIPSTKRSISQRMCSVIQSDVSRSSIDKDMHCERTGQKGAGKYLRESYYYRIKCSVTNSLVALMRKWYLNSSFQPYNYSPKTLGEGWCDKNQVQQSNLHVEGKNKEEGEYKIERRPWRKGIEKLREKHRGN